MKQHFQNLRFIVRCLQYYPHAKSLKMRMMNKKERLQDLLEMWRTFLLHYEDDAKQKGLLKIQHPEWCRYSSLCRTIEYYL